MPDRALTEKMRSDETWDGYVWLKVPDNYESSNSYESWQKLKEMVLGGSWKHEKVSSTLSEIEMVNYLVFVEDGRRMYQKTQRNGIVK